MNKDIDILARTIYGEARGETKAGQIAVGLVIINRYKSRKWFAGRTIADTCLKPWQFSCWNANDPNCGKIRQLNDSILGPYWKLAEQLINNEYQDVTNGATHYHTKKIKPAWANGKLPCAIIGNHVFYKDIE